MNKAVFNLLDNLLWRKGTSVIAMSDSSLFYGNHVPVGPLDSLTHTHTRTDRNTHYPDRL